MRWLYSLHLRVPGSTVLLVANQCDGALDSKVAGSASSGQHFVETAIFVEKRARELLKEWQGRRGTLGNGQPMRCRQVAAGVTVLPQVRKRHPSLNYWVIGRCRLLRNCSPDGIA